MNTKATTLNSSDPRFAGFKPAGLASAAPAVFIFDPATGDVMSMNSGAVGLIARFGLDRTPRLTLASIERGVMAEGKVRTEPTITEGLVDSASELRRVCRRPDGSVIALSRVWAPGLTTMLVIEDMTAAEQERRRRRIWDMMVSHLAQSGNVAAVLTKALRIFCLLSASSSGEVWLPEGKALIRRSMRVSAQAAGDIATTSRLKGPDDSAVGRAWSGGKPVYDEARVALPIHAGDKLVAVLVLGTVPSRPSDYMVLSLIESLAPLFGLALFVFRQSEELQSLRLQVEDRVVFGDPRVEPSRQHIKPMSVVAGMRAAG